jgi:hypothetical protein
MMRPHPLRDAVVAMALQGLPRSEIARQAATSERRVRVLLSQARAAGVAVPYASGYLPRNDNAEPIETSQSEAVQAERRRAACDELLARLVRFHGQHGARP